MQLKRLPTHPLRGSISAMLPDLRLRHLGHNEWQVLRDMRLSALRESPQSFSAKYDEEERYGQERWQAEFDRGDWIVGELDGKHICLAGVTKESSAPADERYLEYVWVAPDFRRRGAAFNMLTEIIGELKKSGVRTVLLYTLYDDNSPARLLYKQLDFIPTNRRQKLGADPEKRWWEWLRLEVI